MVYSKERRAEVLAASDAGKGTQEVALLFAVSESWVRRVKQERRELGKVEPKLTRDRTPDWAAHADWLRAKVAEQPDATLLELVALAAAEREWITSDAAICRALQALRLTRKKRRSSRANKIARTSPSAAPRGSRRKRTSIRRASSSSTKRGPKRT
jgi:transposase